MGEPLVIRVQEVVGSDICVASDDGQRLHKLIAAALREGRDVRLSFLNVTSLTSAFLNAAVGQLYGEFSEEQVRKSLSVCDMDQDDVALLKRVVETAKEYFRDPAQFREAHREVIGEGDGDGE